ncbi:hypothetical protein ACJX0J_025997, partial [Zea mays]
WDRMGLKCLDVNRPIESENKYVLMNAVKCVLLLITDQDYAPTFDYKGMVTINWIKKVLLHLILNSMEVRVLISIVESILYKYSIWLNVTCGVRITLLSSLMDVTTPIVILTYYMLA